MASASFLKLNELVVDKAMYILLVVGWKFTNRTDAYGFLAIFDLTLVWVLCYFVFPCSPNLRKVGGGDYQQQGVPICSKRFPKPILLPAEQGSYGTELTCFLSLILSPVPHHSIGASLFVAHGD